MKNALQFVRTALAPLALTSAPLSRLGLTPLALVPLALAACVAPEPVPAPQGWAVRSFEGDVVVASIDGREDFTVYELLMQMGALLPPSATPSVEVHRTLNGEPLVIPVDYAAIHFGDSSSNVLLREGDLVRISSAR